MTYPFGCDLEVARPQRWEAGRQALAGCQLGSPLEAGAGAGQTRSMGHLALGAHPDVSCNPEQALPAARGCPDSFSPHKAVPGAGRELAVTEHRLHSWLSIARFLFFHKHQHFLSIYYVPGTELDTFVHMSSLDPRDNPVKGFLTFLSMYTWRVWCCQDSPGVPCGLSGQRSSTFHFSDPLFALWAVRGCILPESMG